MKTARPYQVAAHEAIRGAFKKGQRRVLIELATGLGKTVIFVLMASMASIKGGKVLILVNRDVLIEQALEELKVNGVFAQREQGTERASLTAQVVVGSVQSMQGKWLMKWPKDYFKLVITDESHGSAAATFKRILDHFISAYHVGVTATAERHDKRGLWAGYEDIVYSMSLKEAIEQGWLCGFQFHELDCPVVLDEKLATHATFAENEEVFDSRKYLPRLADLTVENAQGAKGLLFLPNCRVSNQFALMLKERGLQAEHIDSSYMSPKETSRLIAWFAGDKQKGIPPAKEGILCNADLLSVGFNCPDINLVGLYRPIASTPMYKQRLGRGTRPIAPVDDYNTVVGRLEAIAGSAKPHCIAEGTLVATDQGYIPIEKVTKSHLVWDGTCFCKCDGAIYKGEQETITYCGLTATPDHKVWIGLAWYPLSEVAKQGVAISLAGDGWSSIWAADHLWCYDYKEGRVYVAYGDEMHNLRSDGMETKERPNCWSGGMYQMWAGSPIPKMVYSEGDWSDTAVQQSERSSLRGLWREGYPIQFHVSDGGPYLDRGELGNPQGFAARSNRKQWSLRTWEFEMVNPSAEPIPHTKEGNIPQIPQIQTEPSRDTICGRHASEVTTQFDATADHKEVSTTLNKTKRRVWDILNCGPLHRFTANGLIVSNCKVLNVFWENGSHNLASPSCLITDDKDEREALDKKRKPGQRVDLAQLELQLKAHMDGQAEEMRKYAEKVANSQATKNRGAPFIGHILRMKHNGNEASSGQMHFLRKLGYVHIGPSLSKQQAYLITETYKAQKVKAA